MNGRALGDRAIEVSPSSARVLERAAEILTPFPVCPSLNLLTRSQARIDLDPVIGPALHAASVISNVVRLASDAHIHLLRLKEANQIHLVSSTPFLPLCNRLQCHRTCQPLPVNPVNRRGPPRCREAFHSVPVIGNVALKAVVTTTLLRMFRAYVAEQVALKLP
jgi:hypothetical protein